MVHSDLVVTDLVEVLNEDVWSCQMYWILRVYACLSNYAIFRGCLNLNTACCWY